MPWQPPGEPMANKIGSSVYKNIMYFAYAVNANCDFDQPVYILSPGKVIISIWSHTCGDG